MRCPRRQCRITTNILGGEEVELTHGERSRNPAKPRIVPPACPVVVRTHTAKNPHTARRGHDRGRSGVIRGEPLARFTARTSAGDGDGAPRPLSATGKSRPRRTHSNLGPPLGHHPL